MCVCVCVSTASRGESAACLIQAYGGGTEAIFEAERRAEDVAARKVRVWDCRTAESCVRSSDRLWWEGLRC